MSTIDIIKDHKQHFIKRLITRNPLLKCTASAYREDITELIKTSIDFEKDFKQTSEINLLQNLLSTKPKKAEILNIHKKNIAKCSKIKNEVDDYFHTTGQLSFFLGFPFVYIPLESDRYYLAPLFLWAISCKITATSVILNRLCDESGNALEPEMNRILQVWLAHEKNIHLKWENNDELNWSTVQFETQNALSAWKKCNKSLNIDEIVAIPNKESLNTIIKPQVITSAVIGYIPIKGQALLDDLDKLEELFKDKTNKSHILDCFLKPRILSQEKAEKTPAENNKWLVTESDHSQESVIWNARKFDLTVLQGPPGTGKSQVIVNLIADALANNKKVLVVCQKKAALEVLKKRLTANGLGELLQLIDDIQKDRMRIIKSLKNIELTPSVSSSSMDISNRDKISIQLEETENILNHSNQLLAETYQGQRLNYGNLKARLYQLSENGFDIYGNFENIYIESLQNNILPRDLENLKTLLQEAENFNKLYQECNYSNNPWRYLENVPNNQLEINSLIKRLNSLAISLNDKAADFYKIEQSWFTEHPWLNDVYSSFLPQDSRKIHNDFKQLSIDTQSLKKWLKSQYIDSILELIRQGKIAKEYQQLKKFSGYIGEVNYIKEKLEQIEVFQLLFKNHCDKISSWKQIIECLCLQAWLNELNSTNKSSKFIFEENKNKLQKATEKKRNTDIKHILLDYSNKMAPRNSLENNNLLRLRKSTKAPKTSLRQLYTSGFNDIHKIYPVLLTNPETVSSILELQTNLYDLVIIDEASQMFMADALPILYRAKSVFISGDNKQMPPSDFFMSLGEENINDDEDEDDEDEDDIADKNRMIPADGEYCLLDAAEYSLTKGNPNQAMLSVHYRSEFKELIDFSNHAFYEGKLIAASSNKKLPDIIQSPIELNQVKNPDYQTGVNFQEALEVVNRIEEIWNQQNSLSLGVITLNVKQKDKIDDLLFEKAQLDSNFANRLEQERNKTKESEDIGFFVRSVEHVQGDERDIIILSTVYDGIRKNFGAINKKEKGRKRLNVAITRAKLGIIIYSSLNIDTISNENQRDDKESYWFWKYMCYARAISSGDNKAAELILQSLNPNFQKSLTEAEPDSYFEQDVAEFLRKNNYHVDYQIGESGFRIDLGVKNNINDSLYLCGIECDGRQYHSAWSARLNDIWRQKILESKGWRIIRIWSNDWFDNREVTQNNLLSKLKN